MVCIKMGMNIEHEILDKLASDMSKEIDYDVLVSVLNWIRVELPPFNSRYHAVDIADWCANNCMGEFMNHGVKFAFEESKDAEWFILRWR
jgi:hypothetical protein